MKYLILPLICFAAPAMADHEFEGRDIALGATLYQQECASCHGANLEGQPDWRRADSDGVLPAPPHDRTGHTWHHDNALLYDYTYYGGQLALSARGVSDFKSGMPGFGDTLSEEEIWSVLAYIRSTWPAREKAVQDSRNPKH